MGAAGGAACQGEEPKGAAENCSAEQKAGDKATLQRKGNATTPRPAPAPKAVQRTSFDLCVFSLALVALEMTRRTAWQGTAARRALEPAWRATF